METTRWVEAYRENMTYSALMKLHANEQHNMGPRGDIRIDSFMTGVWEFTHKKSGNRFKEDVTKVRNMRIKVTTAAGQHSHDEYWCRPVRGKGRYLVVVMTCHPRAVVFENVLKISKTPRRALHISASASEYNAVDGEGNVIGVVHITRDEIKICASAFAPRFAEIRTLLSGGRDLDISAIIRNGP